MLILTFIALSIISIVSYNKDIINEYQIQTDKNILKQNTNNILKKINLSKVKEWETFYINKNDITKNFEVLTWTINKSYKFIDSLWNKIKDITSFDNKIYVRDLHLSTDIIKKIAVTSVPPNSFPNLIIHYDSQDTDWDQNKNNEPLTWSWLSTWVNKVWLPNALKDTTIPVYNTDIINTFPAISFNGTSDAYNIANNININTSGSYPQKSFAIVLKTWADINTLQNIYEQWSQVNWYAFQIYASWIYMWMWNTWIFKTMKLGDINVNTPYYIIMNQEKPWVSTLKWYLNWKLINTLINIPDQTSHIGGIWLWKVNWDTINLSNSTPLTTNSLFNWYIWEFISWNHTLTNAEIINLKKYIEEKWNIWKSSILDNVNISIIVKDINYTVPH